MYPDLTPKDLLRYLYGETDESETRSLQNHIDRDWTLREEWEALNAVKAELDKVAFAPSPTSVRVILQHSRNNAPETVAC